MDKHKEIAEKITYALDGYISDHNNRNFGDADGWLRHIRNGWEDFIEAHPDCLNFHEYLQHQQSKVEELKNRVDAVTRLAQALWEKSNEKHMQGKVWESKALGECADEILDVLEQALKGEQQ